MKNGFQVLSVAALLLLLLGCGAADQSDAAEAVAAEADPNLPASGEALYNNETGLAEQQTTSAPDMHNAETSLDIAGTYTGVLPCADCEGIETKIDLNTDGTAMVYSTYLGKDNRAYVQPGTWKVKGSLVYLKEGGAERIYFAGENYLKQYNGDGKEIEGELAGRFILRKQ